MYYDILALSNNLAHFRITGLVPVEVKEKERY